MQGPSYSRRFRIRTSLALGASFIVGATAVFASVHVLGRALGVVDLPVAARAGLGAAGLLTLAGIDVRAARRSMYCPLGRRRQTPNALMHRHSPTFVATVWGFDIGLAVTTVRVAALTWGAFLLVGLGMATWFTGFVYGVAFAVPIVVLLWTHKVGRLATIRGPVDPGLEAMLAKRKTLQVVSAVLLAASGVIMIGLALFQ